MCQEQGNNCGKVVKRGNITNVSLQKVEKPIGLKNILMRAVCYKGT